MRTYIRCRDEFAWVFFLVFVKFLRIAGGIIVCKIHFILSDGFNYVFDVYTQEEIMFFLNFILFISHMNDKLSHGNDIAPSAQINFLK